MSLIQKVRKYFRGSFVLVKCKKTFPTFWAPVYLLPKPKWFQDKCDAPTFRPIISHAAQAEKPFLQMVSAAVGECIKLFLDVMSNGLHDLQGPLPNGLANMFTADFLRVRAFASMNRVQGIWQMNKLPNFLNTLKDIVYISEFDIESMYTNINQFILFHNILHFTTILLATRKTTFTVRKHGKRWLATSGTRHVGGSHTFQLRDLMYILLHSVFCDKYVTYKHRKFQQDKGIPMGGILSPCLAEIFCLLQENRCAIKGMTVAKRVLDWLKDIPPWLKSCLPLEPVMPNVPTGFHLKWNVITCRYRDNILLFWKTLPDQMTDVKTVLETCYHIPFKMESEGCEVNSLGLSLNIANRMVSFCNLLKETHIPRYPKCSFQYEQQLAFSILCGDVERCLLFSNDHLKRKLMAQSLACSALEAQPPIYLLFLLVHRLLRLI